MPALQPGSKAPGFSLPDRNGTVQSLHETLQKGSLLLTFFKVTCPTCQYALPFFDRLNSAVAGNAVTFWAVSQNNLMETDTFNREFGIDPPQLFDSESEGFPVSNAYGITHVPSSFLIEQDGTIAASAISWDKSEFELIRKRLAATASIPGFVVFNPGEDVLDYRAG